MNKNVKDLMGEDLRQLMEHIEFEQAYQNRPEVMGAEMGFKVPQPTRGFNESALDTYRDAAGSSLEIFNSGSIQAYKSIDDLNLLLNALGNGYDPSLNEEENKRRLQKAKEQYEMDLRSGKKSLEI